MRDGNRARLPHVGRLRSVGLVGAIGCLFLIAGCATTDRLSGGAARELATSPYTFRLIGEQRFDHELAFGGTVVGGLSGIDYDPGADLYYLISDDRSQRSPTRFYTARLQIDATGFRAATLQDVVTLRHADGSVYAEYEADSEAIRFDRVTHDLWWSSEGLRQLADARHARARLIDPFVRRSTVDGRDRGDVPLPAMFHIVEQARGPRDNIVFEGLSFSTDFRSLWVAMEGPLIQDGPMPTMTSGALTRLSRYDRLPGSGDDFGPLRAQYAYPVDPIPSRGAWTASHAQTGVSEILAIDDTHLFVLERALVVGPGWWRIRLFEADVRGASDVQAVDALKGIEGDTGFVPMRKRLVLDFDTLGIAIDNLEGMCFGPTLPNGHRTLVLVADDNFNRLQKTQLLALEIIPR